MAVFTNDGCLGVETEKIDDFLKGFMQKQGDWFLDDTIHLCCWYIRKMRWYHVCMFGHPFSDKYYMRIRCGSWITKIAMKDFEPLNDYPAMDRFIDFVEVGK